MQQGTVPRNYFGTVARLAVDIPFPLPNIYKRAMHADFLTTAMTPLLLGLNLIGLAVLAASGALAAARKRLDVIGACFFALVTATGGGTLRDLLIGAPIF